MGVGDGGCVFLLFLLKQSLIWNKIIDYMQTRSNWLKGFNHFTGWRVFKMEIHLIMAEFQWNMVLEGKTLRCFDGENALVGC